MAAQSNSKQADAIDIENEELIAALFRTVVFGRMDDNCAVSRNVGQGRAGASLRGALTDCHGSYRAVGFVCMSWHVYMYSTLTA
jgi:hypothetical protein